MSNLNFSGSASEVNGNADFVIILLSGLGCFDPCQSRGCCAFCEPCRGQTGSCCNFSIILLFVFAFRLFSLVPLAHLNLFVVLLLPSERLPASVWTLVCVPNHNF